MTTKDIIDEFAKLIVSDNEYTLKEMKQMLEEVYKSKSEKEGKTPRKALGKKKKVVEKEVVEKKEKKKREPTVYNLFMRDNYSVAKAANPDANGSEIMKIVAKMWQDQKEVKA